MSLLAGFQPRRILLVRTDKIGDLVLTTPAIAAVKRRFPHAELHALVSRSNQLILQGNPHLAGVHVHDRKSSRQLASELRQMKFDVAVCFQTNVRVGLAVRLAGISIRIGPLSKWWSYVFFNHGIRQKRSEVKMHEAEYNLQLLHSLSADIGADSGLETEVFVQSADRSHAAQFFADKPNDKPWVIVHPGMQGSARNFTVDQYVELARAISSFANILVTGSPAEAKLVEDVRRLVPEAYAWPGLGGLRDFIGVIDHCQAVVIGSTGPMHIANALGKHVLAVFSPIRVQSKERWGPFRGRNALVFEPKVSCPAAFHCLGEQCPEFDCMQKIDTAALATELKQRLASPVNSPRTEV